MAHAKPSRRRRWLVMGLVWAIDEAVVLATFSLGVMLPAMSDDLGLSVFQGGTLGSANWIVTAASSLAMATALSRYSPKAVITVVAVGGGLLALAQGLAPSYEVLIAGRLGFMVFAVARMQAEIILIRQWFSGSEVIFVNGLTAGLLGIGRVATLAGTPLLLRLLGTWRAIYHLSAAAFAVLLPAWLVCGAEADGGGRVAPQAVRQGSPLGALRRHPVLWVVASCQFGSCIPYAAYDTFWPTFALRYRALPLTAVGALMSLFPLGAVAGSFLAAPLSNRLGRRKPLIWSAGFGLPVVYLALVTATSVPLLGVLLFVAGYFAFVVVPLLRTFPFDMPELSAREVAVALGLMSTFTPLGGSLGPIMVGGLAAQGHSMGWALGLLGLCAPTLGIGGLLLPETGRRRRPSEADAGR